MPKFQSEIAKIDQRPPKISVNLLAIITLLALLGLLFAYMSGMTSRGAPINSALSPFNPAEMPLYGKVWSIIWLLVSLFAVLYITPRSFIAGFLIGLWSLLISWRIVGQFYSIGFIVWGPIALALLIYIVNFLNAAKQDLKSLTAALNWIAAADWQIVFLRLYFGFDMIPHCTEKLFTGAVTYDRLVTAFAGWHVPLPQYAVILGGLCELGITIGIGMGLMGRLAGFCAFLYFAFATYFGNHLHLGFTWNSAGGGWEYCLLMGFFYLSFIYRGAGRFSLDALLIDKGWMPKALMKFAVPFSRDDFKQSSTNHRH